jgi:hypothetical protein
MYHCLSAVIFGWEEQPMYEGGHRTYISSFERGDGVWSQPSIDKANQKATRHNMYFTTNLIVDRALGMAFASLYPGLENTLGLKLVGAAERHVMRHATCLQAGLGLPVNCARNACH